MNPKTELTIKENAEKEREVSDKKYAIKLVERIVFALLALAFLGMASYIWNLLSKR